jgi:DnaJ domain
MGSVPALKAAVDLLHFPSQAVLIRAGPLPEGVHVLLRIAAGDEEAISQTSEGWSRDTVREAAAFFLEQVLLHPNCDSYRVLGASSEASHGQLRQNMSLLLQWLHPDLDRREARSVFVARVTRAWNDLKTSERRAAYDRALHSARAKSSSSRLQRRTQAPVQRHVLSGAQYRYYTNLRQPGNHYTGLLHRIMFFLFGGPRISK